MPLTLILARLPSPALFLLLNLMFIGFSAAGVVIVRRCVHHSKLKLHNDVAGFIFAAVGVIYGVLLTFVVMEAWQNYQDAREAAQNEATIAMNVLGDISAYPDSQKAASMTSKFLDYLRLVVGEEYPLMSLMKTSPATQAAFNGFMKTQDDLVPRTKNEELFVQTLDQETTDLLSARAKRLLAGQSGIPVSIWLAIMVGALMTIGFTFLFGTENRTSQLVMNTMLAIVLASIIFVIVSLEHPFAKDDIVPKGMYQEILKFERMK